MRAISSGVKSWKTTLLGAIVIVRAASVAILAMMDDDPATVANWDLVVEAIVGFALLLARDGDTSSEDSGVPVKREVMGRVQT